MKGDEHDWQDHVPLWVWDLITLMGVATLVVIAAGKATGWWR
jgi:hypothetical protein